MSNPTYLVLTSLVAIAGGLILVSATGPQFPESALAQ
jgi:hypothetical protein